MEYKVSVCENALQLDDAFANVTEKQHEVLRLVGDNFTSKQIAHELGISISAVNQRIETVRARAGSVSRLELARAYREYRQAQDEEQLQDPEEAEEGSSTAVTMPEQDHALPGAEADELAGEPHGACLDDAACRDCEHWPGGDLGSGQDAGRFQIIRVQPPSVEAERVPVGLGGPRPASGAAGALAGGEQTPGPVPDLLDGRNGRLGRTAAIVVIAFGLLLVSVMGLGVLHLLAELF